MKCIWQKLRLVVVLMAIMTVLSAGNSYAMRITVVTTTGKALSMEAEPEDTIADVKDFVFQVTQIHVGTQRMYLGDVALENERTLASYNISDGDTIQVKMGAGVSGKDEGLSGFVKALIWIAVLAAVVLLVKKLLTPRYDDEYDEENQDERG